MIARYGGDDGKRNLIAALRRQYIISDDPNLAATIADFTTVTLCESGSTFIRQEVYENDLYFIITGNVSIQVNGHEVAKRRAGQHVGDMALIDPTATRAASVVALGDVIVGKI